MSPSKPHLKKLQLPIILFHSFYYICNELIIIKLIWKYSQHSHVNFLDIAKEVYVQPLTSIPCANKNDAIVKFTLSEIQKQIVTSQYELYLPSQKQLLEELNKELESFEGKEE
ncbi:DUF1016 family protein [Cloacibacterium normanense]|nr:DUF1016 family protein [Cloacibacterium normanense]